EVQGVQPRVGHLDEHLALRRLGARRVGVEGQDVGTAEAVEEDLAHASMMHPGRGPRQGRRSSRGACGGRGIIGTMPVPRPGRRTPVRRAMSTHHSDPWRWRELVARELRLALAVHEVPVREAAGRVLASAVRSPEDVPAVAVAAMDGFAVRRADLLAPAPTRLPVAMDLPARLGAVGALAPGSAARIMTGAPVPAGADLIVEVEATDADPRG